MLKKILFLMLLFFLFFQKNVLASGFSVTSIGGVTTNVSIKHWWYSGINPTIKGVAQAGSTVDVNIDGNTQQVAADSSGNWQVTTSMASGDHNIGFTSNGSKIDFTLTLGKENVNWDAVGKQTGATLPNSGIFIPTLLLGGGGTSLLWLGKKLIKSL
jgi:hypothetical protein